MRSLELVVGVDGSPENGQAVEWAANDATRQGTPLLILHAYSLTDIDAPTPLGAPVARDARANAEAVVADNVARLRKIAPEVEVRGQVVCGSAMHALVDSSASGATVVLGNRGRGGFASLLLGSVSQNVALHAHGPVVVVRGRPDPQGPVVVGVDGSLECQEALRLAFDQAAARATGVVAVRAYRASGPSFSHNGSVLVEDPDERRATELAALDADLAAWAAKYPHIGIDRVVAKGHPRLLLTEYSARACLVVVGNRGLGGLSGLLLGSVGLHLLHHADCPVLIARAFQG
jgi:nucleotide-binding universal stress UspA family protein